MKRKLVKQGKDTLTLSLPKKWIIKNKLSITDEIELIEKGNDLIVRSQTYVPEKKKLSISADKVEKAFSKYIRSACVLGYDSIVIEYSKQSQLDTIKKTLQNDVFGYEIMNQEEGNVIINNVSEPKKDQFRPSLERNYKVVFSMLKSLLVNIKESNFSNISNIEQLEMTNNKLTSFNKNILILDDTFKREISIIYYVILEYLEKIADEVLYLSTYLNGKRAKEAIDSNLILFLEEIINLFDMLLDAQFKGISSKHLDEYGKHRLINYKKLELSSDFNDIETATLHYLITIVQYIGTCFYQLIKLDILDKNI